MEKVYADISAEKALLSCIMQDNNIIDKANLKVEEFYHEAHKVIYSAMKSLRYKHSTIDTVTLNDELGKQVDEVGGLMALLEIDKALPTTAMYKDYVNIIKREFAKREYVSMCSQVINTIDEGNVDDVQGEVMKKLLAISTNKTAQYVKIKDAISEAMEYIYAEQNGEKKSLESKFVDFDNVTGGLRGGSLNILAARPAMGKTAFALNLAIKYAEQGKKVLILSLEMTNRELATRIIAIVSGVRGDKLKRPDTIDDNEWSRIYASLDTISQLPIFFCDIGGLKPSDIRGMAMEIKLKDGLDVIFIDYMQLMNGDRKTSENRQQEVTEISRTLKCIAKEQDVPVIALSQLSRGVEGRQDKHPQLMDLRESGSIEQDADMVMFLYRDEYYNPETELQHVTELIIAKNRNGSTATINLYFDGDTTTFRSLSKDFGKYA